MSEKRILCVGMCVLDIIHVCADYPIEDTDKRCLNGYWQRGGNASNNSTVLSKLGAKCEFLGMTSASPAFSFLYDDCKDRKIMINNCPKTEMNPPFSSIILVQSRGTRTIVHSNPGFPILTYEHFKKIDLKSYSWIHFEGRNPEETKQMIDMIRSYNRTNDDTIKISTELEKLNKDLYTLAIRCDVVFISKDMAQYMNWSSAREAVYGLRGIVLDMQSKEINNSGLAWPMPSIICPWGSDGSDGLCGGDNSYTSLAAVKVNNVVDSLGAGDTFVAAVIFALNNMSKNLAEAIDYGNRLAAFKIKHRGYDCVENFKF